MSDAISRRGMIKGACGVMAGAAISDWAAASPMGIGQAAAPNAMDPSDALKQVMTGNARYVAGKADVRDFSVGRAARVSAQYPIAAILGCADSRVSPELIFDQGPGDLFVVRVAGNYVNVDNLASLEYSVEVLGTPLVVVLGHTNCGAVNAVVKNAHKAGPLPGHIFMLVDAIQPGVEKAIAEGGEHELDHAIEQNVRYNVERLKRAQPVLVQKVKDRKLQVVGAVYQLATGQVKLLF